MNKFLVLDAARDYMRIGVARSVSPKFACLFIGVKGKQLEHVGPHCFQSDRAAAIEHMTLSGIAPDEVGFLAESEETFEAVFKHFRRFLTVERERDKRKVIFRFYDPRILRTFLPSCTLDELRDFFGPIAKFHCQGDESGLVMSFWRDTAGKLVIKTSGFNSFFEQENGVRPDLVLPLTHPRTMQEVPKSIKQIRENLSRVYRT